MAYSTFKWVVHNHLMVSFASAGLVRDAPWTAFIRDLEDPKVTAYLSTNAGTAEINSLQRKMAANAIQGRKVPIAVVTDERLVRGIVTAAGWLGMEVRPFAWAAFDDALRYLQISASLAPTVVDLVEKLKAAAAAEGAILK